MASVADGPETVAAVVQYAVDGDTLAVTMPDGSEERVRLIGVNTPELGADPEPYGTEAAAYTAVAIEEQTVYLETDIETRDRYGRLLACVWTAEPVGRETEVVQVAMFNARLLANGYAQVTTVPPNIAYAEQFVEYERAARAGAVGRWVIE